MTQLFHPAFRHLWYLASLALLGLIVLGYAYEKLNGMTSGLAILGFTASIVHASAWWFTMGPASPLKKFFACFLLYVAALASSFLGRAAFLYIADLNISDQPFELLLENQKFIGSVVPAWWLSLSVLNEILKESLRWRLNYANALISPRTSLGDMFMLTAILGVVIAISNPVASSLIETDYSAILIVSLSVNVVVIIPLTLLVLKGEIATPTFTFLKWMTGIALIVLVLLAFSRMFTDAIEELSNVAVGFTTLIVPYLLMLLLTRENRISLSSGWFDQN